MPLTQLNHVTVRTQDMEGTKDFYEKVLGLHAGPRPPLRFPGYWLYCGEQPVVHLVPDSGAIGAGPSPDTGNFDHIAFLAEDFELCSQFGDRTLHRYRALAVKQLGGTGRVHDWELSRKIRDQVDVQVFLAGGLNAENVGEAISRVYPYGLDICSGVRTNGHLDAEKLDAKKARLAF